MVEKKRTSSKQQLQEKSSIRKSSKHVDKRSVDSKKSMSKKGRSSLIKKSHSKKSRVKSRKGYLCFPFSIIGTLFPPKEESGCSVESGTKSSKTSKSKIKEQSKSTVEKSKRKLTPPSDKSVLKDVLAEQKVVDIQSTINVENYMKFSGLLSTLPFSSFLGSNLMTVDDIKKLLRKRPDLQEQLRQILGDKLQTPTLKPIKDLLDELSEEGKPEVENETTVQRSSLKKDASQQSNSKADKKNISKSRDVSKKNLDSHSKLSVRKSSTRNCKSRKVPTKSIFRQLCDKIFFKTPEIEKKKQPTSRASIVDVSFMSHHANQELKTRYKEWLKLSPKNQKRCTFEEYVKIMVYVDELKKNSSSESKKERRRIKAWLASLGHETIEKSSQTDASTSEISRPSFFDTEDLITDLMTPSIGSICRPSFLSMSKEKCKAKEDGDGVLVRLKTLANELAELKEMSRVDQNIRTEEKSDEKLKDSQQSVMVNANERPIVGGLTFSESRLPEADVFEVSKEQQLAGEHLAEDSMTMNQVKELCFGLLNQISLHSSRPSASRNPRPSAEPIQLFHMQTEFQYDPLSEVNPCSHLSKFNIHSKSSSTEDLSEQLEDLALYKHSKSSINLTRTETHKSNKTKQKVTDKTVMNQVINLAKEKELVFHYADSGFNSNGSKEQEEQQEQESSDESAAGEAVAVVSETCLAQEGLQRTVSDTELFQVAWEEEGLVKASSEPGLGEEVELRWLEVDTGPLPEGPRRCRSGVSPRVRPAPPGARSAPHLLWPSSSDLSSQLSHTSQSQLSSRTSSLSETRPISTPCLVSVSSTNLPVYYESCHKPPKSSKLKNLLGKLKK